MFSKRKIIRVGEIDLNVVEAGTGPTLLFLHYWGGSSRTWGPVIEELATTNRCVAIDFRGWGRSSKAGVDHALDTLADDVMAVIAELGLTDYSMIGHSMGGKVAQLIAARHPHGLKRLILIAPAPPTGNDVPEQQRRAMLDSYQTREGVETAIGILSALPLPNGYRQQVIEDTLVGAPDAKRAWTQTGMVEDIGDAAARITVPVRIIVGSADRVEPESVLRAAFREVLPAATFTVLPGAGHLSPLEAAGELAGVIRSAQNG